MGNIYFQQKKYSLAIKMYRYKILKKKNIKIYKINI